jgi:hypothetical protein
MHNPHRQHWSARASLAVSLALFTTTCLGEKQPTLMPTPDFAPGQEWSIKSEPQSTAKVIIGRIEPWNGKVAVHVSVIDIPAPASPHAVRITEVAHSPFEKMALAASVDRLLATDVAPLQDFEGGYQQWKENHGGIYTISVAEMIELLVTH